MLCCRVSGKIRGQITLDKMEASASNDAIIEKRAPKASNKSY